MAHFAKVRKGIVTRVIVADPEFIEAYVDTAPGQWLQCSYNTRGNVHTLGGTPLRGNFPGVGYIYDYEHDVFYAPQPYLSWVLNTATWTWEAPVTYPGDGVEYRWDESAGQWVGIG